MAQQERAIKTRHEILLAAAAVFDERGYSSASIAQILNRCRATKGALYFHFPSKESLALGVMDAQTAGLVVPAGELGLQRMVDLTMLIAARLRTDVLLRAGIRLTVEYGTFNFDVSHLYQGWISACEELLTEAAVKGELLPGVQPAEVARLAVTSFTGMQLVSQVYSERADLADRIRAFWRSVLPGIAVASVLLRIDLDRAPADPVEG